MKRAALVIVIVFAMAGYIGSIVNEAITGPLAAALA